MDMHIRSEPIHRTKFRFDAIMAQHKPDQFRHWIRARWRLPNRPFAGTNVHEPLQKVGEVR